MLALPSNIPGQKLMSSPVTHPTFSPEVSVRLELALMIVRANDATVAGAVVVEPIRQLYRANTELKDSTDMR